MSTNLKVSVLGAAGGIGQPLSLLLKLNPYIQTLSLYDMVNIDGVAADLAHIDTNTKVVFHMPKEEDKSDKQQQLKEAIVDSDFIIIPAGVPRKPGMTRGDLFNINASICAELAESIAINAPNSFVLVISNPVNSTVPIFKEILQKHSVFSPERLLGVTALDQVRANTFASQLVPNSNSTHFFIPVVGGHSGHSIVPLFSQSLVPIPPSILDNEEALDSLIYRVQNGGDEVLEAKKGKGSATLSMAYAANKFFNYFLNGYLGKEEEKISSYIYLDDSLDGVVELKKALQPLLDEANLKMPDYLSVPQTYNNKGVKKVYSEWVGKMTPREKEMFLTAIDFIDQNIEKGINYFKSK